MEDKQKRIVSWINDHIQLDELSGEIRIITRYTADDEYADCMKCRHCCDNPDACSKLCGAEHGWHAYERLEAGEWFKPKEK